MHRVTLKVGKIPARRAMSDPHGQLYFVVYGDWNVLTSDSSPRPF